MEDWRLVGNFKDITGNKFKKIKFKSTEKNDHEHCEFCGIKITDIDIDETHLIEGYVTKSKNSNQMKWVCEKYYLDFKDKFDFTDQE